MPRQIQHTFSSNLNRNVMPRHPSMRHKVQIRDQKIPRPIDVTDSKITKISALPLVFIIKEIMFLVIPTAITEIEASQEGAFLIDHNYFLVMAPEERNKNVIWMPEHFDILMELFQIVFDEFGIVVQGDLGLHV